MIVAGIGCGRETSSEDIVSLIFVALSNFGIAQENLTAIATETSKADERGIASAARSLSIPIVRCPVADLGRVADQVLTRSLRVQEIKGVPSIAETTLPRSVAGWTTAGTACSRSRNRACGSGAERKA